MPNRSASSGVSPIAIVILTEGPELIYALGSIHYDLPAANAVEMCPVSPNNEHMGDLLFRVWLFEDDGLSCDRVSDMYSWPTDRSGSLIGRTSRVILSDRHRITLQQVRPICL